MILLAVFVLAAHAANAQLEAQCDSSSNGTTFNGTVGSEQQLSGTTIRTIPAQDANQGVAVDGEYLYSIDNFSITKHNKTTGEALLQWYGGKDGPIIHLDGGVVIDGILYAPHSNYPESPITSSIEMWNATTLEHIGTHSFGIHRGSLTWIDQDEGGTWYGTFANYDRVQKGQMVPYGLTMNTQVVQFKDDWEVAKSWIFPEELYQSFSPMSNSGGSFGPDGWLYVTGHDAAAAYVIKIPAAGSTLIWDGTIELAEIAGQGIAWDRSQGRHGSLYGISREERQIVEMNVPLQNCSWNIPSIVGQIYLPDDFQIERVPKEALILSKSTYLWLNFGYSYMIDIASRDFTIYPYHQEDREIQLMSSFPSTEDLNDPEQYKLGELDSLREVNSYDYAAELPEPPSTAGPE